MKSLSLLIILLCAPAFGASRYYLTMLSYDDKPATLKHAHVFVDFAQVDESGKLTDEAVISWLPKRDGGRELDPLGQPEEGYNADLATTLAIAAREHRALSYWPPLEIDVDLFTRAKARLSELAGKKFVLFDRDTPEAWSDISAANLMDPRGFGFLSGPRVTKLLLQSMSKYIFDLHAAHPEVLAKIRAGSVSLAEVLSALHAEAQDVWSLK